MIDKTGQQEWPVDATYKGGTRKHGNNYWAPRKSANGGTRPHKGVDINIGSGNEDLGAPVYVTHDGVIERIGRDGDGNGGGNRVRVRSDNSEIATYYMHMDTIMPDLKVGDRVSEGQQVGTIGKTGVGITDVHLHYEIISIINGVENYSIQQMHSTIWLMLNY